MFMLIFIILFNQVIQLKHIISSQKLQNIIIIISINNKLFIYLAIAHYEFYYITAY